MSKTKCTTYFERGDISLYSVDYMFNIVAYPEVGLEGRMLTLPLPTRIFDNNFNYGHLLCS
jgi:hypothetical protein